MPPEVSRHTVIESAPLQVEYILLRTRQSILLQQCFPSQKRTENNDAIETPTTGGVEKSLFLPQPIMLLGESITNTGKRELSLDLSDCNMLASRTGTFIVVASTTAVYIIMLHKVTTPEGNELVEVHQTITVPQDKVVHLMMSPLETYLVMFCLRDSKDSLGGNMSIYNLPYLLQNGATSTVKPIIRCMQASWPAVTWTADEAFCVRYVHGLLVAHDGNLGGTLNNGNHSLNSEDDVSSPSGRAIATLELQLPNTKDPVFECPSIWGTPHEMYNKSGSPYNPTNLTTSPKIMDICRSLSARVSPLLAVFKPHHNDRMASFSVYKIPMFKQPYFSLTMLRAEEATISWSRTGTFCCVIARFPADSTSYYGHTTLTLINLRDRKFTPIEWSVAPGSGPEAVHDVRWSPTADEFLVIYSAMPKNKATLYNEKGVAIYQFGEAARNLILWAPTGRIFALGGTGGLAGEFQFFYHQAIAPQGGVPGSSGTFSASCAVKAGADEVTLGSFAEKSTDQCWSPSGRYLLCSTQFSKLRIDNKYVIWKHNGERVARVAFTSEEGNLYQSMWLPQDPGVFLPLRAPSPTIVRMEAAKPALFRPRGGANEAIRAMMAKTAAAGPTPVRMGGPVGAVAPLETKKKRRR